MMGFFVKSCYLCYYLIMKVNYLKFFIAIFSVFLFLISCLTALPILAATTGPNQVLIDQLNRQLDDQKAKIDELTSKITEYQINVKNTQKEAVNLKNQILLLDNQIAKTNLELQLKQEQSTELQLKIDQTNLQIKQSEEQIISEKSQLGDVLRLIARYEDRNYISIILGNNSFSDFFDQLKYSSQLQEEMQRTLNRVQESEAKLIDQQKDLNKQKDNLSDILNKLEDTKAVLNSQKQDKNQLVTATKKSEKKFHNLITDLKKQQAAANAQVAAIEKQLRTELAKKGTAEKFNTLGRAVLNWPVDPHRITCLFRDPDYPYRYLFEHSGLDIGVSQGTPVKAAETGYIAKAARGTQWYGNYVMIIHGGNITTLYGHLSVISVSQDQYVTKGQVIGLSGNTGFSSGPHLHLEVRANGIPVDPLNYLP